jgi:hypothetical protein
MSQYGKNQVAQRQRNKSLVGSDKYRKIPFWLIAGILLLPLAAFFLVQWGIAKPVEAG